MKQVRTRLWAIAVATTLGAAALGTVGAPASAVSNPPLPTLTLDRTITSQPWAGSTGSANKALDLEGSAYVPGDNSMWVSDDNGDRIFEINPSTGALKRKLVGLDFQGIAQLGTAALPIPTLSDSTRTDDFESITYDGTYLYIFSGNCCSPGPIAQPPFHPTSFRLQRDSGGVFQVESWQPLPEGQDPTGAGYRPGVGIYYGHGTKIKTYDYATNTIGTDITVKQADGSPLPAVSIDGITFTDNATMFVSTSSTADPTLDRVMKVNTSDWRAATNWTFNLRNAIPSDGPQDPRSVEIIGDTYYVLDGYDGYATTDTNRYRIWVYTLGSAPAPTASFTAIPTSGRAPFNVAFTDTSTPTAPAIGAPTAWDWDFGDSTAHSTLQNPPPHPYTVAGTYTATLTATNATGFTTATQKITVKAATALPGGYTLDGFGGIHPFRVGTGPNPPSVSGNPYWVGWDIARGLAVLSTGTGGYTLDGFGGIHKFRIGTGPNPPSVSGNPYWVGWDIARGIAVLPNGRGGYMLDGFGGVHPFALGTNAAPAAIIGVPYRLGQDLARGITINPDGKGGYVVDRTGKLWPFKIRTGGTKPPAANNVFLTTLVSMQGASVIFDGSGGYTLDGFGGLHPFGVGTKAQPPAAAGASWWPGWDIARDVATFPDV